MRPKAPGLTLFFFFLLFFSLPALADLGPKPTVKVTVLFEGARIAEPFEARMLGCNPERRQPSADLPGYFRISEWDAARKCYWEPAPLAWGGQCKDSQCSFTYFMPDEFKLAAYLPGQKKVFVSAPAVREKFDSVFLMRIPAQGMADLADATEPALEDALGPFLLSLAITVLLELAGTLLFFWRMKVPRSNKLLGWVVVANLLSVPVVWFGFPLLGLDALPRLAASEAFAFVFEAGFLFLAAKPLLARKQAIELSLLNNALSLGLGGALYLLAVAALGWPLP